MLKGAVRHGTVCFAFISINNEENGHLAVAVKLMEACMRRFSNREKGTVTICIKKFRWKL